MDKKDKLKQEKVVHGLDNLEEPQVEEKNNIGMYIGAILIIVAGIITGYFLSKPNTRGASGGNVVNSKNAVGSKDITLFKDTAEGELQKGGINGEGTHKLLRPGGDSQTVYLTSSVIDLNQYVGKKVKVWGESRDAAKAGWLMDVGRLEVVQ